jgi:hypothetical protein
MASSRRCQEATSFSCFSSGGRIWWAHFEFTRINIEPTILRKSIEDVREAHASPCVQLSGNTGLARKNSHAAKNRFVKFGQMVSGGDGGPDGLANIFNRNGT